MWCVRMCLCNVCACVRVCVVTISSYIYVCESTTYYVHAHASVCVYVCVCVRVWTVAPRLCTRSCDGDDEALIVSNSIVVLL